MNPTPLPDVARTIALISWQLLWEHAHETDNQRWPRAGQHTANIGHHNPTDKTAQAAISPDPVNSARAQRIERTLRRVCRELEDEHAAGQNKRQPCQTEGCTDPASRRQLCRACYEWQRRHGHPRRIRQPA